MVEAIFDNKINLLKALAIILVISGHLGISIIPFFPTYSFHIALFFFISGYLFKEKYLNNLSSYSKTKAKRLLVPYFEYSIIYLIIAVIVAKFTGIFYGAPINIKNYIITPLLGGNDLLLMPALWFVTQLFISLNVFVLVYKQLKKIWDNKYFHLIFFLILAILAIQISFSKQHNIFAFMAIKTLFSTFFIYFGFYYKNFIEGKFNIFNAKWIGGIIAFQSVLWLFNTGNNPIVGVSANLYYIIAQGIFYNQIIPILTSITGIWASLFVLEIIYPYLKNNKFIKQIGENTYHIMAVHIIIIYLISSFLIWFFKLPENIRGINIYWIYSPYKTVYFYLLVTIVVSTFIGIWITLITKKIKKLFYNAV